ncbi:MAG TPA: DNA-directed RNA polymerase subunit beta, partial [Clostridiales bacterium]|nr:DNA-directed RNA polymerase subunit beta [Clostridiales bacterium]
TLQEILTVKSDDVIGRVEAFKAIVKGKNVPKPGIPESFKVLVKELQSLGLDVTVLDENDEEIDLKQNFDMEDSGFMGKLESHFKLINDAATAAGFEIEGEENDIFLHPENGEDTDEDLDGIIADETGDDLTEEEEVTDFEDQEEPAYGGEEEEELPEDELPDTDE